MHLSEVWEKGGEGGIELANKVLETLRKQRKLILNHLYDDELSLKEKIETIATEIYGADGVTYTPAAAESSCRRLKRWDLEIFLYVWQRHSIPCRMIRRILEDRRDLNPAVSREAYVICRCRLCGRTDRC